MASAAEWQARKVARRISGAYGLNRSGYLLLYGLVIALAEERESPELFSAIERYALNDARRQIYQSRLNYFTRRGRPDAFALMHALLDRPFPVMQPEEAADREFQNYLQMFLDKD